MSILQTGETAYTEYAVEVNNENGFVFQIDTFRTLEAAESFAKRNKGIVGTNEYLNIIYIDYDENGDEIRFGTVC